MATNALPEGTQALEFGGLLLHGFLRDFQDTRQHRIASHEFDRRDGGQTEWMGRAQHQFRATLYFVDQAGFASARDFIRLIDENPTRLLVHPLYGRMTMTCSGPNGAAFSVDQAVNAYTMPVEFIEANLDAQIIADTGQGVAAKTQAVTSQAAVVTTEAADFTDSATDVTTATDAATDFATAAYSAATDGTVDPSLASQLGSTVSAITAAIAAIRSESADDPSAAPAVAALETLAALCQELGAAYLAQRPPLQDYVTQEPVHILVLARQWYGADAPSRVDEILANNPTLRGAVAPAGMRLKLATATV